MSNHTVSKEILKPLMPSSSLISLRPTKKLNESYNSDEKKFIKYRSVNGCNLDLDNDGLSDTSPLFEKYFHVKQTRNSLSITIRFKDVDYDNNDNDDDTFSMDEEDPLDYLSIKEQELLEERRLQQDLVMRLYGMTLVSIPTMSFENFIKLLEKSSNPNTKSIQNE
jgi:hypothetical protein